MPNLKRRLYLTSKLKSKILTWSPSDLRIANYCRYSHQSSIDAFLYSTFEEVRLNDEERELVGKLTTVRGLPFDSEKRFYEYSEVPDCQDELAAALFFSRKV
jgi:hypothetical protein